MKTYKVKYQYSSQGCDTIVRTAYVLAKDFNDAERKVKREEEDNHSSVSVYEISKLEDLILI